MASGTQSQGFLYYNFGEKFLEETLISIETLLAHNPNAKVCLATDRESESYVLNKFSHLKLDQIKIVDRNRDGKTWLFKSKLNSITPYDRTIFLDGDTYITSYIENLFQLLDTFDFVAVPDEAHPAKGSIIGLRGGYKALGYYNCGFFMFRKSPAVHELFKNWEEEYSSLADLDIDQGGLLRALVKTNLRFITLPKEYNLRVVNKFASFQNRVKIIHGRIKNHDKFIKKINDIQFVNSGSRVWVPHLQILVKSSSLQWIYKIRKLLFMRIVKEDVGSKENLGPSNFQTILNKFRRSSVKDFDQSQHGSDKELFNYLKKEYSLKSVFDMDMESTSLLHSTQFDLVTAFEVPTYSKLPNASRFIDSLTRRASKYVLLSLKRNHPDWEWIQLISDRGFYFDPHLTLKLRNMVESDHLKASLLIFERETNQMPLTPN